MKRFEIGDTVFNASYEWAEKFVTCPDCLGSKHVKVVLGDGTEITIECGGCDPGGYNGSTGTIRQYDYQTRINQHTVTGVRLSSDGVEYDLDHYGAGVYYTGTSKNTFATKEEALAAGEAQKAEHEAEENKRFMAKTKDGKSWAWNATYHRRCIKDLERQIEYHRSKVQICAAKAKQEKGAA